MAICKKRAAKKAEKKAARAAKKQARKGSFLGRCLRRLLVCTVLVGGVVGVLAYLGRPGTGDGEDV